MAKSGKKKPRKPHQLEWVIEPLTDEPGYFEKPMFGALACYLHGRLMLVLASRGEPWRGLLLPTEKDMHPSLMQEFSPLNPHPVLGKWLYLPMSDEDFETVAVEIVELILSNDPRIGVEPRERSRKR